MPNSNLRPPPSALLVPMVVLALVATATGLVLGTAELLGLLFDTPTAGATAQTPSAIPAAQMTVTDELAPPRGLVVG